MAKVVSVKPAGTHQTYDLEVNHPDHQFYLANGALTSNSHAISYAITTYQCAHLLTYFPDEWIAASLDYATSEKGKVTGQEDPKAVAIKDAKVLGYSFVDPDINFSMMDVRLHPQKPKTFVPAFASLKKVGAAAFGEITVNRPYRSLKDLIVKPDGTWRHSKFNKGAFETLIKMEAFASLDVVGDKPHHIFKNYRQFHEAFITNYDLLKRVSARKKNNDVYAELLKLAETVKDLEDWTPSEKMEMKELLAGSVDYGLLMMEDVQEALDSLGAVSIEEATGEGTDNYWAFVIKSELSMTRNGKPFMKLKLVGPSGVEQGLSVFDIKKPYKTYPSRSIIVGQMKQNPDYPGFSANAKQLFVLA